MEEPSDFHDWEFLQSSVAADTSIALRDIEGGSDDGAIKSDYFSLYSERPYSRNPASEEYTVDEGLAISDNPSWVDPDSGSRYLDGLKRELGFSENEFSRKDSGGFWPDGSSGGQNSLPESEKGGGFHVLGSEIEVGSEGIETGHGHQNSDGFGGIGESGVGERENEKVKDLGSDEFVEMGGDGPDSSADSEKGEPFRAGGSKMEVGSERIEAVHQNSDGFEGIGESEVREKGDENPKELGAGEFVAMGGDGSDSSVEMSDGNEAPEGFSVGEGETRRLVWWKLHLELLKYSFFRVRPIWSIPIAATILGVVMLARRLYKMKHKSRRIPLKVSIEEKKASRLMVRAARLNEAVVRRVPIIRSQLPAGGVTPWPVVGLLL